MKLENKVAIVTGGGRDIGKEVSKKLAAEGAKVVINYYNSDQEGEETLKEIRETGGEAILVKADLTKKSEVDKVIEQTLKEFGQEIHILVNVTGGLVARKKLEEMDEDFFNFVMKLNVNTTFLMTQAVVPHMPSGGSIINFASQAGRDGGGPGASAYSTSKGAVMTFTRSMAKELGPKNIRVNALCPGMIATTFHDTFTADQVREKVAGGTPLRREGQAAEVANVVACLASDDTTFMTGTNVDINGGLAFS